ncbi:hypothetical protein F5Y19DRAFT_475616 [Xylariaceae sp. FL1651]|nr:hypothetical protein F5Y19DRAFT_475616 [Xylariaceae sp. FL1651]
MDATTVPRKTMLKLPGFFFPPGVLFNNSLFAGKVYEALLGDVQSRQFLTPVEAKNLVARRIEDLFSLCVSHCDLYTALRGGYIFWGTVAGEWSTLRELDASDTETVANQFVAARREYISRVSTPVTSIVDQWIKTVDTVSGMPPAAQFHLAIRRTVVGALGSQLQNVTVSSPDRPWPPSHLSPQECAWITDTRLRTRLVNLGQARTQAQVSQSSHTSEAPHSNSSSTSRTPASQSRRPTARWALIMAFLDHAERRQWHFITNAMSSVCWTLRDDFIPYAKAAFGAGRRQMVEAQQQQSRGDFWAQRCTRQAIAFVLARVPNTDDAYGLVVYDPRARGPMTMLGNQWKADAVSELERSFNIVEMWYGRRVSNELRSLGIILGDSVELSCGFVWDVAAGNISMDSLASSGFVQRS